ncbi:agamous-like MADS-box protein AGL80 [Carica papaya]|uniref:agamous-like MADS-box protein AGL80 n=1 Tax=Carica papaya TaxID=3649 RepID=UPI000B8C7290|nr:agamous-like MADS-box protein AGL80 [Carica papaya]
MVAVQGVQVGTAFVQVSSQSHWAETVRQGQQSGLRLLKQFGTVSAAVDRKLMDQDLGGEKRKNGLMKKASELATLCGINMCMIIYSPYNTQLEVWPSPSGVQSILNDFNAMSKIDQSKKMLNQEAFIRHSMKKTKDQLNKQRKDNCDKEIIQFMFDSLNGKPLSNLTAKDLKDLGCKIKHFSKDIDKMIDRLTIADQKFENAQIKTSDINLNDGDNLQNSSKNDPWLIDFGLGKMIMPMEDNDNENIENNNNNNDNGAA